MMGRALRWFLRPLVRAVAAEWRDAVAPDYREPCRHRHPSGATCTLRRDHDGRHAFRLSEVERARRA